MCVNESDSSFFEPKLAFFREEMLISKHMFNFDVTNQPFMTLTRRAVISRTKCYVCTPSSIGGVKQYVRTERNWLYSADHPLLSGFPAGLPVSYFGLEISILPAVLASPKELF